MTVGRARKQPPRQTQPVGQSQGAPTPNDIARGGTDATDTARTVSESQSEPIRRSIEVEYWVVDSDGRLTEPGPLVAAAPGVEREFVEPVLEIKTTPCETTPQLRAELFERIGKVLAVADEHDMGLVPLATPLNHDEIADLPSERTRIQQEIIGSDFEYVRHCAGTHIHVEQIPGRAIDQLNTLVAIDPALALVNSARRFRGRPLADGARSKLYRWMAYDGLAHQGRLWRYIESREDWDRRLQRRYEEFERAALESGIDRQTFTSSFDPESAVWTPVQLRSEFGTVEWRSPDTALPSSVVELADTVARTVEHLRDTEIRIEGETGRVTDSQIVLPEFTHVLEYVNAAIRDGLASESLCGYLERMGFDVEAYDPISRQGDDRGMLSVAQARERRLSYAERLERDVTEAQSMRAD
ncbi:glutamate--cysteine ligase [Halomicroarcula sp. F28]|nr:glutamate--cysteine ligase [Halomicroarcula salinisoli]